MEINVRSSLGWLLLLSTLVACQVNKKTASIPASMNWLIGHWVSNKNDQQMVEEWKQINTAMYQGKGVFIKGTDTLSKESLSLKFIKDSLYYCATVPNQNEGATILFKLTEQTDTSFAFTNPKHDFPQRIRYVKHDQNNMTVTISTLQPTNKHARQFAFVRQ